MACEKRYIYCFLFFLFLGLTALSDILVWAGARTVFPSRLSYWKNITVYIVYPGRSSQVYLSELIWRNISWRLPVNNRIFVLLLLYF